MESMKDLMIYLISDLMAFTAYIYIYSIFFRFKKNGKKITAVFTLASMISLIVYNTMYHMNTGIISFIYIFLICIFAFSGKGYIKLLVTLCAITTQYLIEIITLVMLSSINAAAYLEFYHSQKSIFAILTITIYLALILTIQLLRRLLNQQRHIDLSRLKKAHLIILITLLIITTSYCAFIDQVLNSKAYVNFDLPTAFILSTLLMVIILILGVGVFLHRLFINNRLETTNKLIAEQITYQFNHYQQLEQSIQETRKIKHDMNNHFLCLSHLLSNGEYASAQVYLQDIKSSIDKIEYALETGNTIVDAIVNDKLKRNKNENITFSLIGQFPAGDFFPLVDLCAIVANSLDNAIEACLKLPQDTRYIEIETYVRNGYWLYKIKNSCLFTQRGAKEKLVTTKQNQEQHGFGMLNIQNAVEKNNGTFQYEFTHNEFLLNIAIPVVK